MLLSAAYADLSDAKCLLPPRISGGVTSEILAGVTVHT